MSFWGMVPRARVRNCVCQGEPGATHHGGAKADTRGRTHGQWRWVQSSPSRRTYRRTRYRPGLRWAWGPDVGAGGPTAPRAHCFSPLTHASPAVAAPTQSGSGPSPLHQSSGPRTPKAPPTLPALLWAQPPPSPASVSGARASHSARPFVGSTPNPGPSAVHFRLHPPSAAPPNTLAFQASLQAPPTNPSWAPVPSPSALTLPTEASPSQPTSTPDISSFRPHRLVPGLLQAHPSQPSPSSVIPAGGSAVSRVSWHSLR